MKKAFQPLLLACILLSFISSQAQISVGGYNVYYGHLHNHSNVSDGTGTPDAAYNYAKNTGKLDFFSLADHSSAITADEWISLKVAANKYNQEGVFTALCGFEWTENVLGHVTVINSENYISTASPTNTFTGLCNWLNSNECVAFFNHPGRNNSTGAEFAHFAGIPTDKIVGMEMWNKTDRFPVYYYTDGYYPNDGNKSWFDEAIERGWKVGAAGSEDNHSGTWGTMTNSKLAVLAAANNRTEIYNALKARRFYTTYDENLALSFKIGGNEMGSAITAASLGFDILASDGDGELFTTVELLKNGVMIQSWTPNSSGVNISGTLDFNNGEYYYIRVKQADNDEAVSSPIWIGTINQLPSVGISSPQINSSFITPASILIEAVASDADGGISKVEFYQGSTLLGEDLTFPYAWLWTEAPAGTYQLTAKAYDDQNASVFSSAVQVMVSNPGDLITTRAGISSAADDMEESNVGNIANNVNSTDIELVYDVSTNAGNQVVGLRFQNLNIPQGAAISNAYVQFTCDEVSTDNCNLTISGEAADNSSPFTTLVYNLSGRTKTTAQVSWIPSGWTILNEAGIKQQTPDISSVIQEIISRPGYITNNPISLIITGTGSRIADSYEGASAQAAKLTVSYTLDLSNKAPAVSMISPVDGYEVDAPATLLLTSSASDPDGTVAQVEYYNGVSLIGVGEGTDYSFTWDEIPAGSYAITAKATDDMGAITLSPAVNVVVRGPNQAPIVSIISPTEAAEFTAPASISINVNAADADGNITNIDLYEGTTLIGSDNASPFNFIWGNVAEGSYAFTAIATDDRGAAASSATVNIIVNPAPVIEVFSARISIGSDDVEESAKGIMSLNGDDIELVYDTKTTGSQKVGLRFNGVSIPSNSVITNAYIQFTVDEKTSSSTNLTIKGEKSSNAATFTATGKVSIRGTTNASVNWIPAGWQTVGQVNIAQQTPDLKSIVQEIIALPNWASGNSLAFIVTGTGSGKRTAVSYETSPAKAAMLYVEYQNAPMLKSAKINKEVPNLSANKDASFSEPELIYYPIPFSDILNVQLKAAADDKMISIEIIDFKGALVKSLRDAGVNAQIELSGMPAGIYFTKVRTLKNSFQHKIIKTQ